MIVISCESFKRRKSLSLFNHSVIRKYKDTKYWNMLVNQIGLTLKITALQPLYYDNYFIFILFSLIGLAAPLRGFLEVVLYKCDVTITILFSTYLLIFWKILKYIGHKSLEIQALSQRCLSGSWHYYAGLRSVSVRKETEPHFDLLRELQKDGPTLTQIQCT